jgi:hypothetical protein
MPTDDDTAKIAAGLKNAPSLEHLLPRLIAAAQGEMK